MHIAICCCLNSGEEDSDLRIEPKEMRELLTWSQGLNFMQGGEDLNILTFTRLLVFTRHSTLRKPGIPLELAISASSQSPFDDLF
jgi:hypothetical protein